jgi:hypothetical protein
MFPLTWACAHCDISDIIIHRTVFVLGPKAALLLVRVLLWAWIGAVRSVRHGWIVVGEAPAHQSERVEYHLTMLFPSLAQARSTAGALTTASVLLARREFGRHAQEVVETGLPRHQTIDSSGVR